MAAYVLHVVESLRPEAGSVAVSLPGLLEQLHLNGIESGIIAEDRAAGAGWRQYTSSLDQTAQSGGLTHLVEQAKIVHLHGWGHRLARTVANTARRVGKPYVISPHGWLSGQTCNRKGLSDKLRAWLTENPLVKKAAAVTAMNESEEHELRTRRVNPNIVSLPYGVNVAEYETEEISSGELQSVRASAQAEACGSADKACGSADEACGSADKARGSVDGRLLLMLGPIHPIEGFAPLLKALSELGPESDDWTVVMAGREIGEWRKMLEAAVRRKGSDGRVRFTSASDAATQRFWLARASILAAPSLRVRFPVSVMQAMAAGVPVLATSCVTPTGAEDVIRICAPVRGDLKAGLRALFGMSDEDRAAMVQRARRVARSQLDWTKLVDQYLRLYRNLI